MDAFERIIGAFESEGLIVARKGSDQADAQAPGHSRADRSVSIRKITGRVLVHSHSDPTDRVLEQLGLTTKDLFDNPEGVQYRYSDGRIVHRSPEKKFRQFGNTKGSALYNVESVQPHVTTVYVVEGEQDVETLRSVGAVAVSNPMGAGKYGAADWAPLAGKDVVVVADKDEVGRAHAYGVARELKHLAASVKLVEAADGKDASDHIVSGHGLTEFIPVTLAPQLSAAYSDMRRAMAGGKIDRPRPTILSREDGASLLYPGAVNTIYGLPEGGKSWIVLAAMAETLKADDGRCLYVDADHNSAPALASRLSMLGVPPKVITNPARFLHVEPESADHLMDIVTDMNDWGPTLACIDSVGEIMPLLGASSIDNDEYTRVHAQAFKPLAKMGAAVALIDHIGKGDAASRGGPIGGSAKLRAIDGAAIKVAVRRPFTPGKGGAACLSVAKDRHGEIRRRCLNDYLGDFVMTQNGNRIDWNITAPSAR
ncbi:toprim domain-containing protein [Nocardia transvalensis]|uniref:toprim domain-containing protein n=1 Tax=Nocardia transvalensis TaxID=37333 RepID=UPI001894B621|nr:toprim domain-containing protein [Nocardia transvalensis]MBF6333427.1 toprim domain-containing protein [Nocardia transvalensis]